RKKPLQPRGFSVTYPRSYIRPIRRRRGFTCAPPPPAGWSPTPRTTHGPARPHGPMQILDQFFISADQTAPFLIGTYNSGLVILSLLVAIFSSGMALQTAHIARMADLRLYRQVAIGTGAIALGGGIWTMHFIGMLAFELCTSIHYDPAMTI